MIKVLEIDPNGFCNAKCWYCPVAYTGNPITYKKNMPIETLKNILEQVDAGRGDFVDPKFGLVLTAHYNEILLYPYFKEMLQLFREYKLKTIIFSNGTPLTQEKIDLIKEYRDVVFHITLNIPSAFPQQWAEYTGFNVKIFDKLIKNLKYAEEVLHNKVKVAIQVNGIREESLLENGGSISVLENAPKIDIKNETGDVDLTIKEFNKLLPQIHTFPDVHLVDRTGTLKENNILSNFDSIKIKSNNLGKKVVGCIGGEDFAPSRSEDWLHISANGDVILCCQDYNFKTAYINIKDKTIKEIWNGPERQEMIKKAYNDFCINCKYAEWQ
jgi:MoaA/NifB/PqqE/SkfB family radical SAM enzyme